MNADRQQAACDLLYRHWQAETRIDGLPDDLRPATRADGYAIQARIERHSDQPLYGWKIAATSVAGQAHIGVDGPLAGRILAERVIADGGRCRLGNNLMRVAELEFAFRIGDDLPPRDVPYTVDEVMTCIATLHPAIEVPDARIERFELAGAAQLVADNACAHRFVLGQEVTADWRAIDLKEHEVRAIVNDRQIGTGTGANVLGDPLIALAWIANELIAIGTHLKAGQIVTTGTCVIPIAVAPGDHVRGDFGPLGSVSLSFE